LLIVIDPSKAAGQNFAERSQELVKQMQGVGLQRLPGDRRHRERSHSDQHGITLDEQTLQQLRELAGM
jgi:delta1-piperideine-2-carboxylate reductase